jgi:hypothetical protein
MSIELGLFVPSRSPPGLGGKKKPELSIGDISEVGGPGYNLIAPTDLTINIVGAPC